jgi:carbon monoxide dehydrogenase subunit G
VEISGTFELKATPDKAWELLNDVSVLQKCIPGCKSLKETAKDQYEAELNVGIGPVRGTYKGTVQIKDRKPPRSYRLIIEGKGGAGFVRGDGVVSLAESTSGGTKIDVKGTGEAGGMLARVGQRLMSGAASNLLKQFFTCLGKQAS